MSIPLEEPGDGDAEAGQVGLAVELLPGVPRLHLRAWPMDGDGFEVGIDDSDDRADLVIRPDGLDNLVVGLVGREDLGGEDRRAVIHLVGRVH